MNAPEIIEKFDNILKQQRETLAFQDKLITLTEQLLYDLQLINKTRREI